MLINSTKNTAKNNLLKIFQYFKQKASNRAPFVFLTLSFSLLAAIFSPSLYANDCTIQQPHETVEVAHIYDGDTVKLSDGRKLRFIGINTPERGRDGKKDEPFYRDARQQLEIIIKANNNKINIIYGHDKQDRYQRLLAHVFTLQQQNITALLLQKGMGYHIVVTPNTRLLNCYQNAEKDAQEHQRGIWAQPQHNVTAVQSLPKSARGFHLVSGVIRRIGESSSSFWLNFDTHSKTKVALRIPKNDLPYFKSYHPKDLINRQIIARGWIYKTKNEQRITIHHPASLKIQNAD